MATKFVESEALVTLNSAAVHLGRSTGWMHDSWRKLDMPAYRVGKRVMFRVSELDRWLDDRRENV